MLLTKVAVTSCLLLSLSAIHAEDRSTHVHAERTQPVKGLVIAPDGTLIPDFLVSIKRVSQNPELRRRTRFKSGEFTINGLTPGRYELLISSPSYMPRRVELDLTSGSPVMTYTIAVLHKYLDETAASRAARYTVSAKRLQEETSTQAEAAYAKAVRLHRQGRLDDALMEYRNAMRADPNFVAALVDVSSLFMMLNEPGSALSYLQRAHEIDSSDLIVAFNIGVVLAQEGDYSTAMKWFESVLEKSPRWALAHYYVAKIEYLQKKYEDAERSLRQAIESDPRFLEASILMATISVQAKKYDQARQAFSQLRQATDNKIISAFVDEQMSILGF